MAVLKLTKAVVAALPADKKQFFWDTELTGFGVRAYSTGRKVYVVRLWVPGSQKDQLLETIGPTNLLELCEAREEARLRLRDIAVKVMKPEPVKILFEDLCARYIEEYAKTHKRSWRLDVQRIEAYFLPTFKGLAINSIDRGMFSRLHHSVGIKYPYQANRCKEQMARMYQLAKLWLLIPDNSPNPTAGVIEFKEVSRTRWLQQEEIPSLKQSLDKEEDKTLVAYFQLLLLTGCRKREILNLKWTDINSHGIQIGLTKNGEPHYVPLNSVSKNVLESVPRIGNYIFTGTKQNKPRNNVDKAWQRIRKRAGLDDVRIHDLRHTAGAWMAQAGESLHCIGKVLNQKSRDSTEKYAHLSDKNAYNALDRYAESMSALLL